MIDAKQNAATILVVDDEPSNIVILKDILQAAGYHVLVARDGPTALRIATDKHPNLILLDIMMPGMDGYTVCQKLKADPKLTIIPVLFVTALSTIEDEQHGFEVGAVDYITKPISAPIMLARVKTHLSLVRVEELETTRFLIIQRLGRAAEYKDNETGLHVIRMSHYSRLLGLAFGFTELESELLLHAAPMHDVGKIGIPDNIILKPGKLDAQEWDVMRKHPGIGAEIIGKHDSNLLELARIIALTHHEKWNGSGYPRGLQGAEIPLAGRIVAIADVFDALTTKRPYKEAWPIEKATDLIRKESGIHFDPHLAQLFLDDNTFSKVLSVRQQWSEQ